MANYKKTSIVGESSPPLAVHLMNSRNSCQGVKLVAGKMRLQEMESDTSFLGAEFVLGGIRE
jgi:hypothetical protein